MFVMSVHKTLMAQCDHVNFAVMKIQR